MTDSEKWTLALLEAAENSTGASARTAKQDKLQPGREASERMAATDWPKIKRHLQVIVPAAELKCIPLALVCAIISRESRGGGALDAKGWGDRGNGWGVMQVDRRHHDVTDEDVERGPWHANHLGYAVSVLSLYRTIMINSFPQWPPWAQLKGAVAAYNFGPENVRTIARMDIGTTGADYSSDVCCRARWFHGMIDRMEQIDKIEAVRKKFERSGAVVDAKLDEFGVDK